MTRDEVMAMSGEELRIKVARLYFPMVPGLHVTSDDKTSGYSDGKRFRNWRGESKEWNPVIDIAAAWMLWQATLAGNHFVEFCDALKFESGDKADFTVIMGNLSPLAITRAFIIAKEAEADDD